MSISKPTILFVHGAYHPPACYNDVRTRLEAAGFEVILPRLASLGENVTGKTVDDDVAVVRKALDELLSTEKEVVLVGHSYGGLVSMISSQGSGKADLSAQGKKGGIKSIVYLSACLAKQGSSAIEACNPSLITPPDVASVFDIQMIDGKATATLKANDTTSQYYFGPVAKEEVDKAMALLEPQCPDVLYMPSPISPSDVSIPQTYVISEQDQIVLLEAQERIVAEGNMKAVRLAESGHAPFLSLPQQTVDAIVEVANH